MNAGAAARKTVLVVEDDPMLRSALTDALEGAGYAVLVGWDGEDGVRLARERAPDVILLDLALPGKSGLDVLEELKSRPATRAIPVIVASSYTYLLHASDVPTAAAVFQKPFDMADLLAQMERALTEPLSGASAPPA